MPTFLHQPLLWGLLLAGVPVLIHLINLMHQRRVEWAAMEFLVVSQRKNRTWVRLKELLLLAMRMLAIALVVLIVAQPLLRDELGALLGGTKTHHVVLLDDSFSMSDRRNGADVFDQGKEVVERIAAMAAEHVDPQSLTLLRFSHADRIDRQTQPDFLEESVDAGLVDRLRGMLKKMSPSQRASGPEAAIRAVAQLLGGDEDQTRIVYVVSDFRANEWDKAEKLRGLLAEMAADDVALRLVDCADRQRVNLAVTDLKPISGTRAAGISMFMEVEVRNFGPTTARNVAVVLDEDGLCQPAVKIREIPPGEAVRERFQVSFATAGQHRLAARLDGDAVERDNARYAVVEVAIEVPVLVIDGSLDGEGALFLESALAPGGMVRTGIQVRRETPAFLNNNPLDDYQVIYLTDVEHLDASAIESLERFVADGGGLAVFVGPRSRAGFINESLWRDGEGLFPLPVAGESELFVDRLERVPDVEVTDHPVFRILAGADNSFLGMINVGRYFGVPEAAEPKPDSPARVIARLRNGAPLAVERRFGKGRVIAWLTTAAPLWNNLGANPSFPVLIQEMQAYLARGAGETSSLAVGETLEFTADPSKYAATVRLAAPGEDGPEKMSLDATTGDDGLLHVRLARTDGAGFYEAELTSASGAVDSRRWAVNVEPREGDLAHVDAPGLSSRLDGVDYTYYRADAFEADRYEVSGYNLSDAFLVALLVLLVAEQLLAWSCSYHPPRTDKAAIVGPGGVK